MPFEDPRDGRGGLAAARGSDQRDAAAPARRRGALPASHPLLVARVFGRDEAPADPSEDESPSDRSADEERRELAWPGQSGRGFNTEAGAAPTADATNEARRRDRDNARGDQDEAGRSPIEDRTGQIPTDRSGPRARRRRGVAERLNRAAKRHRRRDLKGMARGDDGREFGTRPQDHRHADAEGDEGTTRAAGTAWVRSLARVPRC